MAVTIVIPTLNCVRDLEECLSSILDNTLELLGSHVFIHVQDGGSHDDTMALLKHSTIAGLSFSSGQDTGVYSAMNASVRACTTDWIYFLGADDRILTGFRCLLDNLEDLDTVYYGDVYMRSTGNSYDGNFSSLKLVYRNICHQAAIYPVHALRASPFNVDYRVCADWAKNIELQSSLKFVHVDTVVANYNDLSGVSHNTVDAAFERDKVRLCRQHLGLVCAIAARTQSVPTFIYQKLVK